jgi:putative ABC transport system permease protein
MFRHLLRLIWNRRRASRLVIVEIAAAFFVVFVVFALAVHAWANYRRPLGFTYENIWRVYVSGDRARMPPIGTSPTGLRDAIEDILTAVRLVPGVLAAHSISQTPFDGGISMSNLGRQGMSVPTMRNTMTAAAVADLGVRILEGRLFGPQDEGQDYRAVLVNREFVERAFGGLSPVGQRIGFAPPEARAPTSPEAAPDAAHEARVVGVIDDFRQNGEFMEASPYAIYSEKPDDFVSTQFFVKVAPGTGRRLEERIVATVSGAAVGFKATVTPWKEIRATSHLETLLPLRIGATLAVFLLAMVVLGLIGIVWQDVVRRTQEIGVRRAAGASAGAVRAQILLEVTVIGCTGIVIGSLLALQIPLLSIVKQIDWVAALPALGLAALLVLLLAAGAALYPAFLASRREPADALRYD